MNARNFIIGLFLILATFGCGGDGPTEPPPTAKPTIGTFTISPSDIVPPDSALVTWKTGRADSVILFPGGTKLLPVDSGQLWVKPAVPTSYSLTAYNAGGTTSSATISVTMTALAAQITDFRITPDTVVIGDTSVITWATNQADSIVLNNGYGKLNPVDSGQRSTILQNTALYRAVAYSIYGNDTVDITVRVKKPTDVRAINGDYYKGVMGSDQLSPSMRFIVTDAGNYLLDDVNLDLTLVEGDGALSPPNSITTDANGYADLTYTFSGFLGHAVVRAGFGTVDSADIFLRANTIIPGVGGQAQYVLFSDKFIDVLFLNGPPERIDDDPRPNYLITYAVYEQLQNVVFIILDPNDDSTAQNDEDVFGVILTSGYSGKTKDSLGIGSTYDDIKAIYGQADSVFFSPEDLENPPGIGLIYDSIQTVFYIDTVTGNPPDTNKAIFEIHLDDFVPSPAPMMIAPGNSQRGNSEPVNYRRYRM